MSGVSSLPQFVSRGAIIDSATTATQPAAAAGPDVRQPVLHPSVNDRIEGTSRPERHHPRQARRGRRSVTRRRRLDLELLLIIRRAERQAHLPDRSRSDEFDALMAVQRRADRPACAGETRAATPADRVDSESAKGGSRRRRA